MGMGNILKLLLLYIYINVSSLVQAQTQLSGEAVTIFNKAIDAHVSNDLEEAETLYNQLIASNSANEIVYHNLLNIYKVQGENQLLIALCKEGLIRYTNNSKDFIDELVNHYLNTSNNAKALEYLYLGLNKFPKNADYHFIKGLIYDKSRRYNAAIKAYKKTIHYNSNHFDALYNLGAIYYTKGVEHYKVMDLNKDNHEKYKTECNAYVNLFLTGLPCFEKAHQLDPSHISTMQALLVIYDRLQRKELFNKIQLELNQLN